MAKNPTTNPAADLFSGRNTNKAVPRNTSDKKASEPVANENSPQNEVVQRPKKMGRPTAADITGKEVNKYGIYLTKEQKEWLVLTSFHKFGKMDISRLVRELIDNKMENEDG